MNFRIIFVGFSKNSDTHVPSFIPPLAVLCWALKQLYHISTELWQDKTCICCQSSSLCLYKHTNNNAKLSLLRFGTSHICRIAGLAFGTGLTLSSPIYIHRKIWQNLSKKNNKWLWKSAAVSMHPKLHQNPLNLQSWELTPAEICLPHRLNRPSFSSSTVLYPLHPLIHPLHPSPQTPQILSSLFFPAVFYISIFILLYLITASPLSISFIPCSTLFPSLHPRSQSYFNLPTSRIQSKFISVFQPQEALLSGCSVLFLSIHPSLYQFKSNVIYFQSFAEKKKRFMKIVLQM